MDLIHVAARVATGYAGTAGKCAQCGGDLSVSEVAAAMCAECVRTGPHQPATVVAARRKPAKKPVKKVSKPRKDVLKPGTEYSLNVELSLTADFEGDSSKNKLLKKFQSELFAAVKEAVATTAKELSLRSTGVVMKPIEVAIAVTDLSSDDYEDSED